MDNQAQAWGLVKRPKRRLSEKQAENLRRGREIMQRKREGRLGYAGLRPVQAPRGRAFARVLEVDND